MKREICLLGCLTLMVVGAGCSTSPAPAAAAENLDADAQAIRTLEENWNKDWAARDPERCASYYSDDATLMIPNMPMLKGKDAIRASLKEFLADPNFTLKAMTSKVEAARSGDLVYSQGTYTMTMSVDAKNPKGKVITDKGKYLTIYRKQADGSYKAIEDIDNSDLPMPATK